MEEHSVRIVCISDTHTYHDRLLVPEGDLLIHAGDFTFRGRPREIEAFSDWLAGLPHPHKIVIAGNHELLHEEDPPRAQACLRHGVYLQDREVTVAGLRIWGSPWQPEFCDWAFNLPRGPRLAEKWGLIPKGIAILVTHGPPAQILDRTRSGEEVGCADLREAVHRVRPRVHVFGHIHEGYGQREIDGTIYVNAASCDEAYRPIHPPVVIDL
jgi:predicted phosphodiesterase